MCLFSLSWCVHTWRRNIKFLDWKILISNFFLSLFYRFSTSKINPIKGNSRRIVTLEDRNAIDLTKLSRPNGDRSQDVCCNREDSPQKWYHMVGWWRIWIEKKTKITNDLFPKRFVLWNLVIMRFYFPRWFVHYWIQFLQFPSCSPCPVYSSSSSEERPINRGSVMLEHLQFLFCPRVHWRWIRCLRNMRSPIHTRNSCMVGTSKPHTLWTPVIDTFKYPRWRRRAYGTRLLTLSFAVLPVSVYSFKGKIRKLKHLKVPFPFFLLRAHVTSSSKIWYVLMSHSYIQTCPDKII
jgi:hypothetical protein